MSRLSRRRVITALAGGAVLPLAAPITSVRAAQKLRVAKVVPFAWTFTPLDIGLQEGIFTKQGLDVEASASAGDAKLQQLTGVRQRRYRYRLGTRHGVFR